MKNILNAENIYDSESGYFLSQKHQNLAEVINLYNESLRVVWIPTDMREVSGPKPFGVAMCPPIGEQYMVMLLSEKEMDNPREVLQRVIASDGKHTNVLAYLDARNDAAKLLKAKADLEVKAEMHDRAHSMFKSPFHSYDLGKHRKAAL